MVRVFFLKQPRLYLRVHHNVVEVVKPANPHWLTWALADACPAVGHKKWLRRRRRQIRIFCSFSKIYSYSILGLFNINMYLPRQNQYYKNNNRKYNILPDACTPTKHKHTKITHQFILSVNQTMIRVSVLRDRRKRRRIEGRYSLGSE